VLCPPITYIAGTVPLALDQVESCSDCLSLFLPSSSVRDATHTVDEIMDL
jgi:hypothetical protein